FNGTIDLWVSVSDGSLNDSETVSITVLPVNDAPYFVTSSLNIALENAEYSQIIEFNDIDNDLDDLTISISNSLGWLELSDNYLSGTPTFNSGGNSLVILNLSDSETSTSIEYLLQVEESNQPPFSNDLDLVLNEDSSIEFTLLSFDAENDDLTYQLFYDSSNGTISGTPPLLIYTPNSNFYGNDSFSFVASDSYNESNTATVSFDVLSVNDIPEATSISLDVNFDTVTFNLSEYISDADGDILNFNTVPPSDSDIEFVSVMGGSILKIGDSDEQYYRYVASDPALAADYVIYKVKDNLSESSVEIITFILDDSRLDSRSAPSALDDNVSIMEDTQNNISVIGFDIMGFPQDGTEQVEITHLPNNGSISNPLFVQSSTNQVAQWTVIYTPNSNFYGDDEIRYKITNPNNSNQESEEGIISITVSAVNDPPSIDNISDQTINEDDSLVQSISCFDIDHSLDISVSSSVGGFDFEIENVSTEGALSEPNITIIPPLNYSGISTITVTASELNGDVSVSQLFNVDVQPVNDIPVIDSLDDIDLNEDESILITLKANDVDFDAISFSVVSDNDNIKTEINNNLLSIYGSQDYFGLGNITITADDGQGGTVDDTFQVNIQSINDIPLVEDLNYNVIEDGIVSIFPQGTDVELNELTFSIAEEPQNGTVTLLNWAFAYTPNSDYNGQDTFTYIASDGTDISLEAEVKLTIEQSNDSPLIEIIDNQFINEDSNFVYEIKATDIDQDVLSYDLQDINPSNQDWSLSSNLLTIPFSNNFNGEVEVTVSVSDGSLTDIENFIIFVVPVNDAPQIQNSISDLNLVEDFEDYVLDISNVFSDIDQDNLEYSLLFEDNEIIDVRLNQNEIIIISEANKSGGPFEVTIIADDRSRRLSISESFNITVIESNDSPVASDLEFDVEEDIGQLIQAAFSDIDNDNSQISVSILSGPSNGSVSIIGQSFLYTPNINFTGQDSFTFNVFDQEFYSNEANVLVSVKGTNDPPQIINIEPQSIQEDTILNINLSATDIDGDDLTFEAFSDNAQIVIDGSLLSVIPELDSNDDISVIVGVSDGEFSNYTDFLISVVPVNDSPSIDLINNQQVNEDSNFTISLSGFDVDEDIISFSAYSDIESSIVVFGNLLTIIPEEDYNGNIQITVEVSDAEFSDSTIFNLEVLPLNDPPVLYDIENQTLNEDSSLQVELSAEDIDGDSLYYNAYLSDNQNADISIDDNIISITPFENWYGQLTVNASVSDSNNLIDDKSFLVDVLPVNDRPIIISEPLTLGYEQQEYIYDIEIYDPDSEAFYFNFLMSPEGMEIDSNTGIIKWIPDEGVLSSGFVSVVVWDTENPISSIDYPSVQEFEINVNPVNDPPEITSEPSLNAIEDEVYIYEISVSDVDSDEYTFNLLNAPDNMQITEQGILTWIPLEGVLTSGFFTVYVYDNEEDSLFDSQSYAISVAPINDPPSIISEPIVTGLQGSLYEYQIQVYDVDDTQFTYQLVNAPDGMNIDFSNGLLTWTPDIYGIFGPITLKVFDGGENFAAPSLQYFTINVEPLSDYITMNFDFHEDMNLISFLGIPDDSYVPSVLSPIVSNVDKVITESLAMANLPGFGWEGSLTNFEADKGYWISIKSESENLQVEALPTNKDLVYNLHEGWNLISYIGDDGASLGQAFPDYMEDQVTDIITEGMAAIKLQSGWVGSLANTGFRNLKGYWVKNSSLDNIDFSWEIEDQNISSNRKSNIINKYKTPDEFKFNQSSKQAFYFFDDVEVEGYKIQKGDWILAFNGNRLVGSARWEGSYTDVPVMGYDNSDATLGYCELNDSPSFKVYNNLGQVINIQGSFPLWMNLSTFLIEKNNSMIPNEFSMAPAYPNPFNPITHIEYKVPYESKVSIAIYDLVGRKLETLIDEFQYAGSYSIEWNAGLSASGIYIIKMDTENFSSKQKIVLVK
ncbi:MAG: hypothetical protein CMG00_02160, partial [Candidatus Marinimicrobia bacterium]|nr:hypothetical protein [Candidatus Neomarinimicrobiota bacterium]